MSPIRYPLFAPVATLLRKAGETITEPYAKGAKDALSIKLKPDNTIVTLADSEAEAFLTPRLIALLPSSQVLGEETVQGDWRDSPLLQSTEPLWVIDPIDGTFHFSRGEPYGIMVCLRHGGQTQAAWIYYPRSQEMLFASNEDATVLMTWQDDQWSEPQTLTIPQQVIVDMHLTSYRPHEERLSHPYGAIDVLFSSVQPCMCIANRTLEMLTTGKVAVLSAGYVTPWDHYPTRLIVERAGGSGLFAHAAAHHDTAPSIFLLAPNKSTTQAMLQALQSITPIEVLDI